MVSDSERNGPVPAGLTPYDVLGYLVPSASAYSVCFLFEYWARSQENGALDQANLHTPFWTVTRLVFAQLPASSTTEHLVPWLVTLAAVALFTLCFYTTGHIIAAISAISIERILVGRGYGFPYEGLLRIESPENREERALSRAFYRGIFFWFNLYLALRFLTTINPPDSDASARWGFAAKGTSALVIVSLVLYWVAKGTTDQIPSGAHWRARSTRAWRTFRRATRAFTLLAARPYDFLAVFLSRYLFTRQPFDQAFCTRFKQSFQQAFDLSVEESGTNVFWLSMLAVRERSSDALSLLSNWVRQYGFARNLATAIYLAFLYILGWLYLHRHQIADWDGYRIKVLLYGPLLLLAGAMVLLVRYYYIYSCYYTKYVFRSFVFLNSRALKADRKDPDRATDRQNTSPPPGTRRR